MKLASTKKRFLAVAIDAIILFLAWYVPKHLGLTSGKESLLQVFLAWFAFTLPVIAGPGATPGGIIMGLRIVSLKGEPCQAVRATFRALFSLLSMGLCGMGYALVLMHPRRQALHDLFTNSLVIEKNSFGEPGLEIEAGDR